MLPGFIVFGSMRSGTTSLYYNLIRHPQVLPALKKQVNFFDQHYDAGERWYRGHFPVRLRAALTACRYGEPVLTGEASPEYIFHPRAPGRIARELPDVQLIALLRNPVERAWSHYHHSVRRQGETLTFEDAIAAEPERLAGERERVRAGEQAECTAMHRFGYLAQGRYAELLEPWFAEFPRERIAIERAEDMFDDPDAALARLFTFFSLPQRSIRRWTTYNAADNSDIPADWRANLAAYFRPHNERLEDLLGRSMGWNESSRSGDIGGG